MEDHMRRDTSTSVNPTTPAITRYMDVDLQESYLIHISWEDENGETYDEDIFIEAEEV